VFAAAYAFNGNLNQWDVAYVTSMADSKSIRIVDAIVIGGFSREFGLVVMMCCKDGGESKFG
jgi:hypothetical protein